MALRLALIGCGTIATRRHLPGYAAISAREPDLLELVAVCDADPERAAAAARSSSAWQRSPPKVYTDVTRLLQDERLDAADVCTPHFLHHSIGVACLDAGVHVLIEKPLGITLRASQQLIAAAERSGKVLATAENIRRGPGQRTARWLFHERRLLGAPAALYSQCVVDRRPQGAAPATAGGGGGDVPWIWQGDKLLSGGGPVLDSGAHFCDTIRYLYGEVESCYGRVLHLGTHKARRGDELVDITSEDTFFATINFADGAVGSWSISWALPGHPLGAVVYYGTEGAIVEPRDPFHGPSIQSQVVLRGGTATPLETYYQEYLQALGEAGRQRVFPHGITDGYTLEIYDFLTAVRDGRPPEIDGEQGMRAKAIALTIYESATMGQVVRVADVLAGRAREYQRPIDDRWGL
jgi:predicted dehydrogenase